MIPDTRHQTTESQATCKGLDTKQKGYQATCTGPDTKQKGYQATCTGPDTNPTRCRIPTPYRPCVYTPLSSLSTPSGFIRRGNFQQAVSSGQDGHKIEQHTREGVGGEWAAVQFSVIVL